MSNRHIDGLDEQTFRHESFLRSQRKRKLIEQCFGWFKTVVGYRGVDTNQLISQFLASAYNFVRMAKLTPATA